MNINFNQIKKLKLLKAKDYRSLNNLDFMGMIKSFNILDNLVYLEYNLYGEDSIKPEIINNFKSLKYLILSSVSFSTKFELELTNLKYLELRYCTNII